MRSLCMLVVLIGAAWAQDYIDGQYFIHLDEKLLQSSVQDDAFVNLLTSKYNIDIRKFYSFNPKKILYVHADQADIARVQQLREVTLVEQNAWAYADQQCNVVNFPGVWGLDRIDQREKLLYSTPNEPTAAYTWDANDGTGVKVYVFDTGIDIDHSDFQSRAEWGYVASDISNKDEGDINGHGTHCAGTIASATYGVAKNAVVVAIKILDDNGSGPWSAIIEGMNWLSINPSKGSHACGSMSVGGAGTNEAVKVAMDDLIATGVSVSVSAGNNNGNACNQTPAYIPGCVTVAATDVDDDMASFSNHGPCVDLFAPGVDVLSTWPGGGTQTLSGTSMSAPHVAGAMARYMSSQGTAPTPANVTAHLISTATPDAIPDIPTDTSNQLLYCSCDANSFQ